MSIPNTATPPLLLTKRLNAFLHAHQSPQLPTLLLTTAHGKLLAHASSQPVSLLRTHATVAASLLSIHTSSSVAIPTALPGSRTPDISSSPISEPDTNDNDNESQASDPAGLYDHEHRPSARRSRREARNAIQPGTITVQLTGGTVIIRRLKCGLLFVCNGGDPVGSPSEVESLISAGGQTTSSLESSSAGPVVAMRRHAAELARWLDDKLGSLKVPEEGIGIE
ncbi:hypothetical protein PT974_12026 [Cladobotryum mycophilum]|uniref:Roadblock/LAMTOR2 domain-containing protein n=1 Tax=Cladobotryum mycophilum TaxID=491253 RepID=A0ABR0S8B4_9HYPO